MRILLGFLLLTFQVSCVMPAAPQPVTDAPLEFIEPNASFLHGNTWPLELEQETLIQVALVSTTDPGISWADCAWGWEGVVEGHRRLHYPGESKLLRASSFWASGFHIDSRTKQVVPSRIQVVPVIPGWKWLINFLPEEPGSGPVLVLDVSRVNDSDPLNESSLRAASSRFISVH